MSKRIYIFAILLLFAAVISSCRIKEMEPDWNSSTRPLGNKIAFELGTAQSVVPQTRGCSPMQKDSKSFLCVEGNDTLYLSCSVMDNNDPVFSPAVKGAPVTNENMSQFYVAANLSPELKYFPLTLVDDSVKSEGVYTLQYYWPQNTLDFYAANFRSTGSGPGTSSVEFTYDGDDRLVGEFEYYVPAPDSEVCRDAEAQPDYAFAIAQAVSEDGILESNDGVVPLKFAHCFTSVTFKIGSAFMDPQGRQVKKVEVIGVPSCGSCNFYLDNNGDMIYVWETDDVPTQDYAQVISVQDGGVTNIGNAQTINDDELTFMLIPHLFKNADAKIRIWFDLHADRGEHTHEMCVEKSIIDLFAESAPKEWLPGKKYIYTVYGEENVGLEISDDPMQEGLSVENTGTVHSYVRAAVVGWWEDSDGNVVAPWTGEGEIIGTGWSGSEFTGEGSKWYKSDEDGFYYYSQKLLPGDSAEDLFASYSKGDAVLPQPDAILILNVYTQSVNHHQIEIAWPDQASRLLSSPEN